MVTSRVSYYGGIPTLFVNDEPVPGTAYITYFEERNRYSDFAQAGYNLFTFATYCGDKTISEVSHIAPFSNGIFATPDVEDYSEFDRSMADILAACPNAMVFPRVNVSMPSWWEAAHPEECNDHGSENFPEVRRMCFASQAWREQAAEFLRKLIEHVQSMPWQDHIIGYQIAAGNTEEWFSFDMAGSIGPALRKSFQAQGGTEEDVAGYRRFVSTVVAESIAYLAGVVKTATFSRLVVSCFYGYTFETPSWQSGHMAMKHLLNCGDIDFFCSPLTYCGLRTPAQDWFTMNVLESIKLHGKTYFAELDVRTYLTMNINESRPGMAVPGRYDHPIWKCSQPPEVCRWMLRTCIARQVTYGYNSWWFDMWGGWYATPELMQEMADLRKFVAKAMEHPHRESIAEVAIFVDEDNYVNFDDPWSERPREICNHSRIAFGNVGAPYDLYEISDFERVFQRYRAVILLAPSMTPAMEKVVRRCRQFGIIFKLFGENIPKVTDEMVREFYQQVGVHLWMDSGDIVYANADYIAVHAVTAGAKTVRLPQAGKVTGMLPAGEQYQGTEFTTEMRQFETKIFRRE